VPLNRQFHERFEDAQRDGRTVAVADAYLHDAQYTNARGVNSITAASILLGRVEYDLRYKDALARRAIWQKTLRDTFRHVDLIALPTMKSVPPKIPLFGGSAVFEVRVFSLQNTVAFNYSGNPAIAIPVPIAGQDVPLTSLQLAGPPLSEARLLNAARLMRSKPQ
jgi:amidase